MSRVFSRCAIAVALALVCVSNAGAETGRWMDTVHRLDLTDLSDASEPVARLKYAGHSCYPLRSDLPRYNACMRKSGFVFVPDSPEKIAADQKRQRDLEVSQMLGDFAQGVIDNAAANHPRRCSGHVGLNGTFNTTCW